jgi:ribose transport system substrate-binding protein
MNLSRPDSLQTPFVALSALVVLSISLVTLPLPVQSTPDPQGTAECFSPASPDTAKVGFPAKKGPYKIAFSNSYFGNNWRDEMLKIADGYVKEADVKQYIKEFKVYNSGQDVAQQIAQIRQAILSGVDAIIVNAAQPSGLDPILEEVAKRGIVIVAFDNTVTSKRAVNINNDQFQMGKRWAEFLAEQTKGKGTVLMVRGLAGTPVDNQQASGAKSVFEKYPGLKIVEVYGNWDVGATQKAVANALASTPQIDGVWGTAACTGTIQAFLQSSRPLVPMTGECDNGFMRLVAEKKVPALVIGQPPAMVAVAIRATIALLQGEQLPKEISLPLEEITTEKMVAGQNFFPQLPDGFVTDISIASCGINTSPSVFAK